MPSSGTDAYTFATCRPKSSSVPLRSFHGDPSERCNACATPLVPMKSASIVTARESSPTGWMPYVAGPARRPAKRATAHAQDPFDLFRSELSLLQRAGRIVHTSWPSANEPSRLAAAPDEEATSGLSIRQRSWKLDHSIGPSDKDCVSNVGQTSHRIGIPLHHANELSSLCIWFFAKAHREAPGQRFRWTAVKGL